MASARYVALVLTPLVFAGCVTPEQLFAAAVDAAGCIDVSAVQVKAGQFQYGGAAACKTTKESHAWTNPSPYAMVQWGGAVVAGELTVRILDSADREVAKFTLGPTTEASAAQGRTEAGFPSVPGLASWTIEVEFTNFTGTMGLQIASNAPASPGADSLHTHHAQPGIPHAVPAPRHQK